MENEERSMDPLTINDLKQLRELALREHESFFERNPHLKHAYHGSLIGMFLCQGAASHYLNPTVGLRDFDIWHFYVGSSEISFPYRAHRKVEDGYKGRSIDFLKRSISKDVFASCSGRPDRTLMKYLLERNTKTKRELLKKAIIGLYPNVLFARVLWKGKGL
ncbi:MAG TPA: hypothetical protein VK487_11740 [Candidatus Bathyarchaeia archaeon]|nr:hypothetical protein [Candidatus Bathyarchaeia archaeon]